MIKKPIITLFGPSASGKTSLAIEVSNMLDSIIINADSKQIYKEIPVITAQPSVEEQKKADHYLYGYHSVKQNYTITDWINKAKECIDQAHKEKKIPILVGGTGMYFKALKEGFAPIPAIREDIKKEVEIEYNKTNKESFYKKLLELDNETIKRIHINDSHRLIRAYEILLQTNKTLTYWYSLEKEMHYPEDSFLELFLCPDRNKIYENCNIRFENMVKNGNLIEEVQKIYGLNLNKKLPCMKVCGLPEMFKYLLNELTLDEAINQSQTNTRHYIKRQFTWFHGQMSSAKKIDAENKSKQKYQIQKLVKNFLLK